MLDYIAWITCNKFFFSFSFIKLNDIINWISTRLIRFIVYFKGWNDGGDKIKFKFYHPYIKILEKKIKKNIKFNNVITIIILGIIINIIYIVGYLYKSIDVSRILSYFN